MHGGQTLPFARMNRLNAPPCVRRTEVTPSSRIRCYRKPSRSSLHDGIGAIPLRLTLATLGAVVSFATSSARAQRGTPPDATPELALSQYQHDRWTTADGMPNQAVDWIARSPDGYLWLGTEGGLVRFDGVRFSAIDRRPNTPPFAGIDYYPTVPLGVDHHGVLWIATADGLVRYKDGAFTKTGISQPHQPFVSELVEDDAGRLWAWAQDTDGPLLEVREGRLVAPDSQSGLATRVKAVVADPAGDILVATIDGALLRVHKGRAVTAVPNGAIPAAITTMYLARDGVLWVGTKRGFGRLQQGGFKFRRLGTGGPGGYITDIAEDSLGDIWLGTIGMGVLRWHAGQLEELDRSAGLSRDEVRSLLVDHDGSVWVGTRGGLDRLRRGAIVTFTPRNGGPPFPLPGPLLLDARGDLVVGSASTGIVAGHPGAWSQLTGASGATSSTIYSLARGREGIWIGGETSLTLYRPGGASRTYTARDGLVGKWVLAITEDSLERVWVGTEKGLRYLTRGRFRDITPEYPLSHSYVRALVVDRSGAVWAGSNGGLTRIIGDSVRSWGPGDGLAGPVVFAIRQVRDGSIWIGTTGGLTRVREGRLAPIRAGHGVPNEMVVAIEEAGDDLWIVTGRGISRMALSELNDVADGRAQSVHTTTFGTGDGLAATEVLTDVHPMSALAPDGRLWFSTAGGLAVIDPRRVPRSATPPAVLIEELWADSVRLARSAAAVPLKVPAGAGRVTLLYTATSLLLPERVRFRYQLVGYDRGWVDATSRERAVSYTNLRPRRYTFRVIASSDGEVWNAATAAIDFTVAPEFYETNWFVALGILTIVAMFFAVHRARVHQLERRTEERKCADEALARLRAELTHATRVSGLATLTASIAHEVNQPLSGVVTNAGTCLRMLSNDPPNVAGASEAARRLIRDGNRAAAVITRLRALFSRKAPVAEPVDLDDATREVIALSRSDLRRSGATLRVELPEDVPAVMGDRVQLQQVILNLLRNACDAVHGIDDRPREIEIRIARDDGDRVRLSVRDSGVGFEADGAEKLFDAFYTTKHDGMGIGLSVCRSIIENHGGRLWAAANDGPGVTFAFSIPVAPNDSLQPSAGQLTEAVTPNTNGS